MLCQIAGRRAWLNGDHPAGQPLADIIIGIPENIQAQALYSKCPQRLASRTAQASRNLSFAQPVHPETPNNMRGQARANRTGSVFDIIGQLHFTARLQSCFCILDHLCIQRIGYLYTPFAAAIARPAINRSLNQNRIQIKVIECRIAARYLCQ